MPFVTPPILFPGFDLEEGEEFGTYPTLRLILYRSTITAWKHVRAYRTLSNGFLKVSQWDNVIEEHEQNVSTKVRPWDIFTKE